MAKSPYVYHLGDTLEPETLFGNGITRVPCCRPRRRTHRLSPLYGSFNRRPLLLGMLRVPSRVGSGRTIPGLYPFLKDPFPSVFALSLELTLLDSTVDGAVGHPEYHAYVIFADLLHSSLPPHAAQRFSAAASSPDPAGGTISAVLPLQYLKSAKYAVGGGIGFWQPIYGLLQYEVMYGVRATLPLFCPAREENCWVRGRAQSGF